MRRQKLKVRIGNQRRQLRVGELVQIVSGLHVHRTHVVALGKSGRSFRVLDRTGRASVWLRYTGKGTTWVPGWREADAKMLNARIVLKALTG